jgi:hypothetical protein
VFNNKRIMVINLPYMSYRYAKQMQFHFPVPYIPVGYDGSAREQCILEPDWLPATQPFVSLRRGGSDDEHAALPPFDYNGTGINVGDIVVDLTGFDTTPNTFEMPMTYANNKPPASNDTESSTYAGEGFIFPINLRVTLYVESAAADGDLVEDDIDVSIPLFILNHGDTDTYGPSTAELTNQTQLGFLRSQPYPPTVKIGDVVLDKDTRNFMDMINPPPWGAGDWWVRTYNGNFKMVEYRAGGDWGSAADVATVPARISLNRGNTMTFTVARQPLWDVDSSSVSMPLPLQLTEPAALSSRNITAFDLTIGVNQSCQGSEAYVTVDGGSAAAVDTRVVQGKGPGMWMRIEELDLPRRYYYESGVSLVQSGVTYLDGSEPVYLVPVKFVKDILYALDVAVWALLIYRPAVGRWHIHSNRSMAYDGTYYKSTLTITDPGNADWVSVLSEPNDDLPPGAGTLNLSYRSPSDVWVTMGHGDVNAWQSIAAGLPDGRGTAPAPLRSGLKSAAARNALQQPQPTSAGHRRPPAANPFRNMPVPVTHAATARGCLEAPCVRRGWSAGAVATIIILATFLAMLGMLLFLQQRQ